MKHRIIESIRQFLIKTILPLRKKKDAFLSNFRFSIVFRISFNYFRLLIIYGGLFMILFSGLYLGYNSLQRIKLGDHIIKNFSTTDSFFNPYIDDGLNMRITNVETNESIYDDISFCVPEKQSYFHHVFYAKNQLENSLVFYINKLYSVNSHQYEVRYQLDLSGEKNDLLNLIPAMSILYITIVLLIIRSSKKGNIKLFSAISAMSTTTNRLTVNNLHCERLNVAGTKSELKDLAVTINDMLDRIETSYESQKQFVSDASHELRTPISVIQGYANLLNRWGKKDESILEEAIEAIQIESKEMQDLVEKLLFLSRHDKKTLKLKKSKFNMCDVVEDMIKETKLVVTNRNILSPTLEDVVVYGDKQTLKQAIRVFIDNAVKYSKDGDTIIVTCENKGGDCVIGIQDNGIGMTGKDLNNIFERFYRSDHVRNNKINGNGLGLSIAKLIILKHTGRIKVRSRYLEGSKFIITLPKIR